MRSKEKIKQLTNRAWKNSQEVINNGPEDLFTIKGDFGCQQYAVEQIVRQLLKEMGSIKKVVSENDAECTEYEIGHIVKIISNSNDHSYKIGSVVCITAIDEEDGDYISLKTNGEIGNWLRSIDLTPATKEEIKTFFTQLAYPNYLFD